MEAEVTNRPQIPLPLRSTDAGRTSRESPEGNQTASPNIPPAQIKTMSDTTSPNHPAVSKICIEYADGSHDEIELMDSSQGLYS